MPDVKHEGARTSYDDAREVFSESGDGIGVATFAADQDWDGVPTGIVDCLPIRVYAWPEEEETPATAWLTLEDAREVRDLLDAAITQVEMTRDQRRRHPLSAHGRMGS